MKKLFVIFIFLLGITVYQFEFISKEQLITARDAVVFVFTQDPCSEPIKYNIGDFDTRFNISKYYFINTLTRAEAIWEEPSGLNLFTYVPLEYNDDVLMVNLIYDYRQEATSKLADIGIVVKNNKDSYDTLKIKFDELTSQYEKEKIYFNTLIADFNKRNQIYIKQVSYWNKRGGAPQAEFDLLNTERLALETESRELEKIQISINNMVGEINALTVVLNRLVSSLNLSVDKYNTINNTRGESFEEGVYYNDGDSQKIDIYEFSNEDKLVRVLAHEFGHALGLMHVDDEKAIMYYLNHDDNIDLTLADINELNLKCEIK